MRANIDDMRLRILAATWSEAVLMQYSRVKEHYENDDLKRRYQGKYDTVFLLEALNQLVCLLEIVKNQYPGASEKIKNLTEYSQIIREMRSMNIHELDYIALMGHKQERFIANTDFGHHATDIQITKGNLIVGGRLNLSIFVGFVSEINEIVDPRRGSLWS